MWIDSVYALCLAVPTCSVADARPTCRVCLPRCVRCRAPNANTLCPLPLMTRDTAPNRLSRCHHTLYSPCIPSARLVRDTATPSAVFSSRESSSIIDRSAVNCASGAGLHLFRRREHPETPAEVIYRVHVDRHLLLHRETCSPGRREKVAKEVEEAPAAALTRAIGRSQAVRRPTEAASSWLPHVCSSAPQYPSSA